MILCRGFLFDWFLLLFANCIIFLLQDAFVFHDDTRKLEELAVTKEASRDQEQQRDSSGSSHLLARNVANHKKNGP